MLGAIIGDIIGSSREFSPTNDYNFELFTDRSGFTDDTVCTVAVADALLTDERFGTHLHDWCRRYPLPKGGYGGRFAQWVASDHPKPYGSYGNGSAMRVSPAGWLASDPEMATWLAAHSAMCTHNHPEGIKGAQAVALAIYRLRNGQDLSEPFSIYGMEPDGHFNLNQYRGHFDETCQGTVPPALWIAEHSSSFEDAIRQAVSLGADADTIGAIAGSMAEAKWGIPEWMKIKAMSYLPPEMKAVVNAFYNAVAQRR